MVENLVTKVFARAGVSIGEQDGADIVIAPNKTKEFVRQVFFRGTLGFGDSYVNNTWNPGNHTSVDQIVCKLLTAGTYHPLLAKLYDIPNSIERSLRNVQAGAGAKEVVEFHYDKDPDFFIKILGETNQYVCADEWAEVDLDEAQRERMKKLRGSIPVNEGDRVLDLGCGWGGWLYDLAEHVDVEAYGITLSQRQANYGVQLCAGRNVTFYCDNYKNARKIFPKGSLDVVTAFGLVDHIGHKNVRAFFRLAAYLLKPWGKLALQTLCSPTGRSLSNPWVRKHVFPRHEVLPEKMFKAPPSSFRLKDYGSLTPFYPPTLLAWNKRLNEAAKEGTISLSPEEQRTWNFYFLSCAGALRARHMNVKQFFYTRRG